MIALPGLVLLAGALVPAATATPPAAAAPRAAVEQPARPAPRPPVPPPRPWGVESPRSAGARFGLGVDLRLDHLEGLEAVGGSTAVGGPGGTVVPLDPGLDNRKFERELELDGIGLQAPVALPRFALGGLAVDPSLVLEVAAVDARLGFRPLTPNETGTSLDGRGTLWGVGIEWVATACRRCRVFWGGGYRFRTLSGLDLDRAARLDGAFDVLADQVRLDADTHLLTGRVGFATRGGRFAPYLGVRGRWSEVEVEDELRFVDQTGSETALRTRLELEDDGVAGVVGLDARLGGRLRGRVETAVADEGTAALVKLVHHVGREARGPALAAELRRVSDELEENLRSLPEVAEVGGVAAYRLGDVLALLDRTESDLAEVLAAPWLGPLLDLFSVVIAEARQELSTAARFAAVAPAPRRPGIVLARWALVQEEPASGLSVLAPDLAKILEPLRLLFGESESRAARGELKERLCVCRGAPEAIGRSPMIQFRVLRRFRDEVVKHGFMNRGVTLTFGIYRLDVRDDRSADRQEVEGLLDLRQLQDEGSTFHCTVYPAASGAAAGVPPRRPFCELLRESCSGCD